MNARGQVIDTTYLSIDKAEERGFIHRDYVAHCLRWSHVVKRLGERRAFQSARLLDIGCGRELPLAKLLYSSKFIVQQYWGVDAGPVPDESLGVFSSGKFPVKVWDRTNFLDLTLSDLSDSGDISPNWVVCFEVLEHVEPVMMVRMLRHARELISNDGIFMLSTPCWNRRDVAVNHVNEVTYEALGAILEATGWAINKIYGTFASIRDYEHLLGEKCDECGGFGEVVGEHNNHMGVYPICPKCLGAGSPRGLFTQLREYYDTNFLSCVFAPLFPAQSRNCLWELITQVRDYRPIFPRLSQCEKPWGSSSDGAWAEAVDELTQGNLGSPSP